MPTDHSLQEPTINRRPTLDWPVPPAPSPQQSTQPRFMFIADLAKTGPRVSAKQALDRCRKIQQAAVGLDGRVERDASPFGDGMVYTICQLPSNRAAASLATVMRAAYATRIRTVALPKPLRSVTYLTGEPAAQHLGNATPPLAN